MLLRHLAVPLQLGDADGLQVRRRVLTRQTLNQQLETFRLVKFRVEQGYILGKILWQGDGNGRWGKKLKIKSEKKR